MASRIVSAFEIVLAEPGAWLVSAAGFLARGGVVLFLAALLQIPSPITLTLIFGVDAVTATGDPTTRLILTISALVGLAAAAAVAMLLAAAWTDVISVRRVRAEPWDTPRRDRPDPALTPARRGPRSWLGDVADVLAVAWLQSLGLLPGVIAVALVAPMVRDVAVGEVLLPSSFTVPYLVRVIAGIASPLGRAVLVLGIGELLATIATRQYLAARGDRSTLRAYGEAVVEAFRRPGAVAGAWVVGTAALLVAASLALWAVALAWNEVRGFFLDLSLVVAAPLPSCGDAASCGGPLAIAIGGVPLGAALAAIVAASLFSVVWIAAIVLVGLASAFRSTLWTLTVGALRPQPAGVAWPADANP